MAWKQKKSILADTWLYLKYKVTRLFQKRGLTGKRRRPTGCSSIATSGAVSVKVGKTSLRERNVATSLNVYHSSDYKETLKKQYKIMQKLSKKEKNLQNIK